MPPRELLWAQHSATKGGVAVGPQQDWAATALADKAILCADSTTQRIGNQGCPVHNAKSNICCAAGSWTAVPNHYTRHQRSVLQHQDSVKPVCWACGLLLQPWLGRPTQPQQRYCPAGQCSLANRCTTCHSLPGIALREDAMHVNCISTRLGLPNTSGIWTLLLQIMLGSGCTGACNSYIYSCKRAVSSVCLLSAQVGLDLVLFIKLINSLSSEVHPHHFSSEVHPHQSFAYSSLRIPVGICRCSAF